MNKDDWAEDRNPPVHPGTPAQGPHHDTLDETWKSYDRFFDAPHADRPEPGAPYHGDPGAPYHGDPRPAADAYGTPPDTYAPAAAPYHYPHPGPHDDGRDGAFSGKYDASRAARGDDTFDLHGIPAPAPGPATLAYDPFEGTPAGRNPDDDYDRAPAGRTPGDGYEGTSAGRLPGDAYDHAPADHAQAGPRDPSPAAPCPPAVMPPSAEGPATDRTPDRGPERTPEFRPDRGPDRTPDRAAARHSRPDGPPPTAPTAPMATAAPTAPTAHQPGRQPQPFPQAHDPAPPAAPRVPVLGVPPYSGAKAPLYPPEPRGVPAVREDPTAALVPDTVVDGAGYGALTVRAASVRGDSHRYQSEPRQDSLAVTRIGEPGRDELLLLAVADGVGSAPRSHVGSQEACRLAAMHLDAVAGDLAGALRSGDRTRFGTAAEGALQRVATLLAHHARERGDDPGAYATTLRALLVPVDSEVRTRGFLAVGDGGTSLLREGEWHLSLTDPEPGEGGMIDTRTAALPHSHTVQATLIRDARPGDVLVLCTDGLSTPLAGDPGIRAFLGEAWGGPAVPAPADFLWQTQYRVKSYDDDRTVVVLWEDAP